MKKRLFVRVALSGFMLLLAGSVVAQAAEIKVLVSPGFVPVLQDLGPKFERATGHKLAFSGASLGAIVKRVYDGELYDVVLSPRSAIEGFVKGGKATAGNVTAVASAGMGVAVRASAATPDVSSPEALKRALLAARSISYPNPKNPLGNPELGIHVERVLARLEITDQMKSKTVFSSSNDVGALLASGEAEVGIGQLQNLGRAVGIAIVGPLPGDLQQVIVFAGVILPGVRDAEAAKAFVDFMRTPEAAAVMKTHRLDPP